MARGISDSQASSQDFDVDLVNFNFDMTLTITTRKLVFEPYDWQVLNLCILKVQKRVINGVPIQITLFNYTYFC